MTVRQTRFTETMIGELLPLGESESQPVRLDLTEHTDGILRPLGSSTGAATGTVRIAGRPRARVEGELEISPIARRRIRYRLRFSNEEGAFELDGWKSVSLRAPLRSMTTLPFTLRREGRPVSHGVLRFPLAAGLLPFLGSFRFPAAGAADPIEASGPDSLAAARWNGRPGRTEVWYTTVSDPVSGTGLWLHHELTAPLDGSTPRAHGWIALFPPGGTPVLERFTPEPWSAPEAGFATSQVTAGPERLHGTTGTLSWDLTAHRTEPPLYTFPRWAWNRNVLPAAQVLSDPGATFTGSVVHSGIELPLAAAPGANARIHGHGNARRWAWLHADLTATDADVTEPDFAADRPDSGEARRHVGTLELVAAVSTRPGLRRLPPLVFLQLRTGRRTWPRSGLRTAVGLFGAGRFRARIDLPTWSVTGRTALRRIHVRVTQPPEGTVAVEYTDPDGSRAVCRNSEVADAEVTVERWWGRWRPEAHWTLTGTAHAEVGGR